MIRFILFSICFFMISQLQATIFVYGDSHASCFFQIPGTVEAYGGSRTMHHVGNDPFDLSKQPIKPGDVILFSFGQIDAGWHIAKQMQLQGKSLQEITQALVTKYIQSICVMTQNYPGITKVVYSILPASKDSTLHIPYEGGVEMRVEATRSLNDLLRTLCPMYGIKFLDVYDDFRDSKGQLREDIRDHASLFHIDPKYYGHVNQKLFAIVNTK